MKSLTNPLKLTIELIPSSSWYQNLRNILSTSAWKEIRESAYKKFGYKCTVCGKKSKRLHCHEVWEFDDQNHIQSLKGFLALCKLCHSIKHLGHTGLTQNKTQYEKTIRHFMQVNKCNRFTFQHHYNQTFKIWQTRSHYDWTLNLNKAIANKSLKRISI